MYVYIFIYLLAGKKATFSDYLDLFDYASTCIEENVSTTKEDKSYHPKVIGKSYTYKILYIIYIKVNKLKFKLYE